MVPPPWQGRSGERGGGAGGLVPPMGELSINLVDKGARSWLAPGALYLLYFTLLYSTLL